MSFYNYSCCTIEWRLLRCRWLLVCLVGQWVLFISSKLVIIPTLINITATVESLSSIHKAKKFYRYVCNNDNFKHNSSWGML